MFIKYSLCGPPPPTLSYLGRNSICIERFWEQNTEFLVTFVFAGLVLWTFAVEPKRLAHRRLTVVALESCYKKLESLDAKDLWSIPNLDVENKAGNTGKHPRITAINLFI